MTTPKNIANSLVPEICQRFGSEKRFILAIAGPPGAGKSTLADELVRVLNDLLIERPAAAVPMDGFHYDNLILDALGLRARKGAPETFDASGFLAMVQRLKHADEPVAIPVFDRMMDLSRASARIIEPHHRLLIIEGNYLLLDQPYWRDLKALFDFTIMLRPSLKLIEDRLIQRWLDHGFDYESASARARGNDLSNARLILAESHPAEMTIRD